MVGQYERRLHRTQRRNHQSKHQTHYRRWLKDQFSQIQTSQLPKLKSVVVIPPHSTLNKVTPVPLPTPTSPSPPKPTPSTSLPSDNLHYSPICDNDLGIIFHVSQTLYKEFEDMLSSMSQ